MIATIKTPWSDEALVLYRPDGTLAPVKALQATYDILDPSGRSWEVSVVTITDLEAGRLWLGPKSDFYVATESGVLSGRLADSLVVWSRGFVTDDAGREAPAAGRFEGETDALSVILIDDTMMTGLGPLLNPWFFVAAPFSSQPAEASLEGIGVADRQVRLDLKSPADQSEASVWLDIDTRRVVKATERGNQVFP